MDKSIMIRKLYTGLILIGFCLLYIFISALLMGWDILYFWFSIIWVAPLYLIYAPIWSIFSDIIGKKYARLPANQKVVSLLIHILGGGIASLLIVSVSKPLDILKIDVSYLLNILIIGGMFAFPFWIVDSMIVENNKKKTKKT
ncbi:hypothetical protein [Paenisporosarcina antarctica]|uniref:Uncharacterized protein n=1 Tax=Paenisporosarcina antarctica TaxID=417367 RepID=A0A4P7A1B0_9BACL|nr:hypothetical protein [Paenisporosarcina antarctica]QBP42681.1 hypothetical protein E2636_16700 [Paenisporosarcina antarctica]